jgi:hypothetical protein
LFVLIEDLDELGNEDDIPLLATKWLTFRERERSVNSNTNTLALSPAFIFANISHQILPEPMLTQADPNREDAAGMVHHQMMVQMSQLILYVFQQ